MSFVFLKLTQSRPSTKEDTPQNGSYARNAQQKSRPNTQQVETPQTIRHINSEKLVSPWIQLTKYKDGDRA
jgi:hypothetical protein